MDQDKDGVLAKRHDKGGAAAAKGDAAAAVTGSCGTHGYRPPAAGLGKGAAARGGLPSVVMETTNWEEVNDTHRHASNALYVDCLSLYPHDPQNLKKLKTATACDGFNGFVQHELARLPAFGVLCKKIKAHLGRCAEAAARNAAAADDPVLIYFWCNQGRHRSVGCGELLQFILNRDKLTSSCTVTHRTLSSSRRGPCGCGEGRCHEGGKFRDDLQDEWEDYFYAGHRLACKAWDKA
jgi:hypothetical protein